MDIEPIGEERDDLRIGALASVILSMNIDTQALGGLLEPLRYESVTYQDRTYRMALKEPEDVRQDQQGQQDQAEDRTVNNPVVWENFTTRLCKAMPVVRD